MEKGDEEAQQHFELLKIFAFGTYSDYKAKESKLPKLSKQQLTKLKQLTIVTMAAENRVISYKSLLEKLDVATVRDLEDLIIDCIYNSILIGRLDQQKAQLQVDYAIGRDLRPGQIDELLKTLNLWGVQSEGLLKALEEKITWAKQQLENAKKTKRISWKTNWRIKKTTIKLALESEAMDTQFEGSELLDDGRNRKRGGNKGNKPPKHGGRDAGGRRNNFP